MGAPLSLSGGGTHRGGRDGMAPHPSYATDYGAVWSRTVEGCFCRELLETAGVDELSDPGLGPKMITLF